MADPSLTATVAVGPVADTFGIGRAAAAPILACSVDSAASGSGAGRLTYGERVARRHFTWAWYSSRAGSRRAAPYMSRHMTEPCVYIMEVQPPLSTSAKLWEHGNSRLRMAVKVHFVA